MTVAQRLRRCIAAHIVAKIDARAVDATVLARCPLLLEEARACDAGAEAGASDDFVALTLRRRRSQAPESAAILLWWLAVAPGAAGCT